ncbi:MAG: hypothetical protein JKY15_02250 [Deltaproteobacteria bacterium]|nr:hypothetical protein [Deltaproteobacteria bacterium]
MKWVRYLMIFSLASSIYATPERPTPEELFQAVRAGDSVGVENLIRKMREAAGGEAVGYFVNSAHPQEGPVVRLATQLRYAGIVVLLIQNGAQVSFGVPAAAAIPNQQANLGLAIRQFIVASHAEYRQLPTNAPEQEIRTVAARIEDRVNQILNTWQSSEQVQNQLDQAYRVLARILAQLRTRLPAGDLLEPWRSFLVLDGVPVLESPSPAGSSSQALSRTDSLVTSSQSGSFPRLPGSGNRAAASFSSASLARSDQTPRQTRSRRSSVSFEEPGEPAAPVRGWVAARRPTRVPAPPDSSEANLRTALFGSGSQQ